jgi:hypothetical protein
MSIYLLLKNTEYIEFLLTYDNVYDIIISRWEFKFCRGAYANFISNYMEIQMFFHSSDYSFSYFINLE